MKTIAKGGIHDTCQAHVWETINYAAKTYENAHASLFFSLVISVSLQYFFQSFFKQIRFFFNIFFNKNNCFSNFIKYWTFFSIEIISFFSCLQNWSIADSDIVGTERKKRPFRAYQKWSSVLTIEVSLSLAVDARIIFAEHRRLILRVTPGPLHLPCSPHNASHNCQGWRALKTAT